MTRNLIKLAAGIAWAGLAVTSAASVNATVLSSQVGNYAAVGQSVFLIPTLVACSSTFNYSQNIKFHNNGCSTGSCNGGANTAFVDSIYTSGRKIAFGTPCAPNTIYTLSSCSC